jgi:hypothetical protein
MKDDCSWSPQQDIGWLAQSHMEPRFSYRLRIRTRHVAHVEGCWGKPIEGIACHKRSCSEQEVEEPVDIVELVVGMTEERVDIDEVEELVVERSEQVLGIQELDRQMLGGRVVGAGRHT